MIYLILIHVLLGFMHLSMGRTVAESEIDTEFAVVIVCFWPLIWIVLLYMFINDEFR